MARRLFGRHFIGPEELQAIACEAGVADPAAGGEAVPAIPFDAQQLAMLSQDHLLLFGSPSTRTGTSLTINHMREFWGTDPAVRQPCFYNQDWYLRETFAGTCTLAARWYLIRRDVDAASRGRDPEELERRLAPHERFPSALLACYAFFTYWVHTGGDLLWKHSFVWCSDRDHHGDRIYVGRYVDPEGVNKNGFNIHRHLSLRECHGAATEVAAASR